MDKLFIPARSLLQVNIPKSASEIHGRIGLITTVQYYHVLNKALEKLPGSVIGGTVLGCNIDAARRIAGSVDSYLYIGSGRFHPISVAKEIRKAVYCLNPATGILDQISEEEIRDAIRKEKKGLVSFFSAGKIGIIVTTKNGQSKLSVAMDLKERMKDKDVYIFIAETINPLEFENHKIGCLINTACPRIIEDQYPRPMVKLEDILPLYP